MRTDIITLDQRAYGYKYRDQIVVSILRLCSDLDLNVLKDNKDNTGNSTLQGLYYARYIGGHVEYLGQEDTEILIFNDKIVVDTLGLKIPYSSIIRIENMDEKKIDRDRVALGLLFFTPLAVHSLIWKKKHLYTVIQYNDGIDIQTIIVDFRENIDSAGTNLSTDD